MSYWSVRSKRSTLILSDRPNAATFSRSGVTCDDTCTVAMMLCPFFAIPIAAPFPNPEPAPVIKIVLVSIVFTFLVIELCLNLIFYLLYLI
ncbi:hypothetical protein D9M69_664120 [compost metagenome]